MKYYTENELQNFRFEGAYIAETCAVNGIFEDVYKRQGYSMSIGVVIFIFSFALSALVNKVTEREPLEF